MAVDVLFWGRDKELNGDPELDQVSYKRLDVIDIRPAPWAWSQRELTRPEWRILRLTNAAITVADMAELLQPEREAASLQPRVRRMRRAFLDGDDVSLPSAWRTWLNDDTRAEPIRSLNVNRNQILALIKPKTPRVAAFKTFSPGP